MDTVLLGLHHLSAIVDDPQDNLNFYTQVLGLRLVKQTVNFDDPYTYHLYYGDEQGRPGTLVTFFPWPGGRRGGHGHGEISAMAFAVPTGALAFWQQHLAEVGWHSGGPYQRDGHGVLTLYDPAGLLLELVEQPIAAPQPARAGSEIAPQAAIQRLLGVTLTLAQPEPSAAFLVDAMGFRRLGSTGERYAIGEGETLAVVELNSRPDTPRADISVGSVHHVAWRVRDDAALVEWQGSLRGHGAAVTAVRDRQYFHSIYFREPGGVLFELATDPPGFTVDEAPADLGTHLQLPPWLEERRGQIESQLPPLILPQPAAR